jgi:hypothetical protein
LVLRVSKASSGDTVGAVIAVGCRRRAEGNAIKVLDVLVLFFFREGGSEGGGCDATSAGAREGAVGAFAQVDGVGVDEEGEVDL